MEKIEGRVIRLLDIDELIINLGTEQFVDNSDDVKILASEERIIDPITEQDLGGIRSVKAYGRVKSVFAKFSIVKVVNSFQQNRSLVDDEPMITPVDLLQLQPFTGKTEKIKLNDEVIVEIPEERVIQQGGKIGDEEIPF